MERINSSLSLKVEKKWIKLFTNIFTGTYSNFLTKDEINKRIKFIILNIEEIDSINIYKCILYSNTNNEIGKLAVDYRLEFIGNNYQNIITKGLSYEIDNFVFSDTEKLNKEIKNLCFVILDSVSNYMLSNNEYNFLESLDKLNEILHVKDIKNSRSIIDIHSGIKYLMTNNQISYSCSFNQNPFTGEPVEEDYKLRVELIYKSRCDLFKVLRKKYKSGIKLKYVTDRNFFG